MTSPAELADADLVILPGSRATVGDLAWLRERGLGRRRASTRAAPGGRSSASAAATSCSAPSIVDEVESRRRLHRRAWPAAGHGRRSHREGAAGCRRGDWRGAACQRATRSTTAWSRTDGGEPFLDGCPGRARSGHHAGTASSRATGSAGRFLTRDRAPSRRAPFVPGHVAFARRRARRSSTRSAIWSSTTSTRPRCWRLIEDGAPAGLPLHRHQEHRAGDRVIVLLLRRRHRPAGRTRQRGAVDGSRNPSRDRRRTGCPGWSAERLVVVLRLLGGAQALARGPRRRLAPRAARGACSAARRRRTRT